MNTRRLTTAFIAAAFTFGALRAGAASFAQTPEGAVNSFNGTGTVFRVIASGSGTNGLAYAWTLDGSAVSSATGHELSKAWGFADVGSHSVECSVSIGSNLLHTASWNVIVERRLWVKAGSTASSPTGENEASAFRSLQSACNAAQNGDVIWVLPGTYAPFYWNSSGASHVSIQAAEGFSRTVVDGWLETDEGYVEPVIWGNWENRESMQIVGFTLEACVASSVSLLNCMITNYDSWTSYYYPAEIPFRNDRLENCLVTGNSVSSMFAYSELVNCTVAGNTVQTTLPWYDPWMMEEMTIGFIGPDCTVRNSIVRFNRDEYGEEINFWDGTSGWYGGALPSFGHSATFPMPATQTGLIITNNPAFVDAVLGDWRLATGSPCLNRGLNSIVSSEFDLAGAPRIQGSSVDLGCYEGEVVPEIPGVPGNVRASQGSASEVVTVTWSPANRAQWYQVFRSASSNNVGVAIGRVDGFSFTDTNAVANMKYWYSVRASNASGVGDFAEAVSGFRTPPLVITTEWMTAAKAGDQYSCQLEAQGGRSPYEWMLTSFKDYSMTRPANSFEAVSGSSVVSGDDSCSSYSLPFEFPFFGETYETVWINSNGTLNFDEYFSDYSVDETSFMNRPMIAAMWRDLTGSVYVSQQTQDSVTFRWSGSYYSGSTINVSATLYADGRIVIKHGSGNASGGLVGVSDGNGTALYENISSSLSSTEDFVFAPVADADWMSIDPATGLVSGRPLANQTNYVTAVVTDSLGNVARHEYTIEVTDCTDSHPVVQFCLPSERVLKVFPQETVEFSVEAVDPDGNDIVYTWIVDGVTNMTGLATAFSWTPDVESSGTHTIACRVSDGYWDDLAATWTVSLPDWFVSPDGSPSNSGKSLASAFDSLQAAIDAASAGDTIYVADGTYSPVSTANKTIRILAAPGASPVIDGGGTNRCVYVGNGSGYTNTVFKGFTLRNGYSGNANGGGAMGGTFIDCVIENCRVNYSNGYYGGGTYCADLENCTVRNCRAYYGGGVSYGAIRNCVIRDCTATYYGGGTYYGTYYDTTIRDNRARQGSGIYGGTYTRCTITGNRSQEYIALQSGTLNYCISWGNTFADGLNADTWRTSLTASYSCIQNGATGTGNSSSDPILVEHPDGHIGPFSTSPALGRGDRSGGLDGVLVRVSATGPGHVSPSVVSGAGSNVVVTATLPNAYHVFSGFIVNGVEVTAGVEQDGLDYRLAFTVPDGMSLVDVVAEFQPTTFYVKPDGNNTNDGLSWATARKTIQSAVNSAVSFDTILVTNGTYGAFSATNNSSFVIRGVEGADNTIVDGGGSSRCAKLGAVQQHTLTTLEGLTLQNGFVNGSGGGSYGGTLRNCILTGNRTSSNSSSYYGGGAAYSLLCNCRVENNWGYYGGGTCYGATENCVITNNSAYSGGGTYYGSHTGDIIAGNRATSGNGGGAYYGAVVRCVVSGNTASSAGGGMSEVAVTNCIISANVAANGGGAHSGTVANSQLDANTATSQGGGAYGSTLVNCTIVANNAVRNASAYNCSSIRTVYWDNALTQSGGVLTSEDGATNPMLVLGDDGIYHLSEHSPFIDAGTGSTAGLPATDLAGGARIQGAAIDCGAVEGGVVGNWVGLSNDGYGSASGAFAVPDGGSVILRAEQGDGEHAFLGFFAGGEALGGVVSSGLVHEVTFAPTAKTTDVVAKFERRTFHVSPDGDDAADGRSWETARRTINAALASAHTGDTVLVADGTYSPFTFSRNDFVAIRSVNGHEATIIDGGGTQRCATFGGTSTVSNDSNAITNAVLEGFTLRNGKSGNGGGAQYGTIQSCRFESNVATSEGGGMQYGVAYSCGFWNNSANYGGGASRTTLRNCTVSKNRATTEGGGCYGLVGYNTVAYGNTAGTSPEFSAGCMMYRGCNGGTSTANNSMATNPCLVYADAGDLRIRTSSPCIDAGYNQYVVASADITGAARVQNGTVDIGAYEGGVSGFVVGTAIVGSGDVSPKYALADATDASLPHDATFTAVETDRPFLGFETNGVFVSAEDVGDTLTWCDVDADATVVLFFGTNIYVNAATGDDANDGFTPETPKRNLQTAISMAKNGETVFVASGTYAPVSVGSKVVRVVATEGYEKTVIDGGGTNRCVAAVSGYDSVFVGFTIRNGNQSYGNGQNPGGGGVFYGEYHNCVIENCRSHISSYGYGGGAFRAKLVNCLIRGNIANAGGGAYDSTLINCTVIRNYATSWGGGGSNGGTVRNSIIWGNNVSNSSYTSTTNLSGGTITYSCVGGGASGTGNTSADPRFVDAANGDYRLLDHSPCIDAASASYVTGDTDLLGNPRVAGAAPDMGCYEGGVELPLPETPQGFTADDARRIGFVRTSWNAADWAWTYAVERATDATFAGAETIGTTASLFFDDTNAVPETTYWYRVRGVNPNGSSDPSAADSGSCLAALVIAEPSLGTAMARVPFSASFSATGGAGSYLWRTGADDYIVSRAASSWIDPDGVSTGVSGDDVCRAWPLPFDFPFYGSHYDKVWVNSNGELTFDGEWTSYAGTADALKARAAIAVFWKDLRTGGSGVTVSTNGTESISFHWANCSYYSGGGAVNASVTLFANGTIVCSYGGGNASGAFVGISAGDSSRIRHLALSGSSMANADDILFTPQDLPAGLSLAADGTLSGTPEAAGSYIFTLFVTDANGNGQSRLVTLEVEENPNIRVVTFVPGEHGARVGGGALVQGILIGEEAVAPTLRAASGWVFDGWDRSFSDVQEDMAVMAQWRPSRPAIRVSDVAAPTAASAGDAVEVSWTLTNWGNAAFSGTMSEEIRLVSVSNPATTNTVGTASFSDEIARDGSVSRTASFTLSKKGMEGEWRVVVVSALRPSVTLHATGVVAEGAGTLTVAAIPLPDLAVESVAAPASLVPGETATVTYTVRNDGAADADGSWTDAIWLVSETTGAEAKVAEIARNGSVAPGGARSETATVAIPETIALAGGVRVKVVADSGDVVVESDDANAALAASASDLALRLYLAASPTSVSETSASVRLTARRSGPRDAALAVALSASPAGQLSLPETLTIPAGSASASVTARTVDNAVVDGTRTVTLAASADGFAAVSTPLAVTDNETPHLYLSLSGDTVREGGALSGSVRRELVTDAPLTVYLAGPAASRCSYPSSVTIGAGEASAVFEIAIPDNATAQKDETYTLRASASGHSNATAAFSVEDDDVPGVVLTLYPEIASEGAGANAVYATLTRADLSDKIDQAIRVRLSHTPSGNLILPSEVTIPKYTAALRFAIGTVDNALDDGDRDVEINGAVVIESCGCDGQPSSGDAIRATMTVIDDDGPALSLKAEPATMREGLDEAGFLVLSHNSALTEDQTVALSFDTDGEIDIPATATIPAGASSVRIPVRTLDDGEEDGAKLVSVYAEDEGGVFAPASTWVQVSDQNLPDLAVSLVAIPAGVVAMERFSIAFTVTNAGFMARSGAVPYAVHLVRGANNATLTSSTLAASGSLVGGIAIDGTLSGETVLTAPELPGDFRVAVVIDPDGTISELDSANNTGWSAVFGVSAAYTAEVTADADYYLPGETISITGLATQAGGEPVGAGLSVDVYLLRDSYRKTLSATTAADGSFAVSYTPSSGECGHYRIGACYPGVGSSAVQDEFDVMGMKRTSTSNVIWDYALGDTATRTVSLKNLSAAPLTGLAARFEGVPADCSLEYTLPDTIPGNGSVTLSMTATAIGITEQTDYEKFWVYLETEEGVALDIPLYFHSQAQRAQLRATPSSINTTMTVGGERTIEVTIYNDGKGDSGPVSVTLPAARWLKVLSGSSADNLAPGDTMTVTLLISPTEADNLTLNSPLSGGNLAVNCANGSGCSVPLKFTPVSESTGGVVIDAVDNYTYTQESAPHLAGATVRITNPYTGALVASGTTGDDGLWTVADIPEGRYQLRITADKHDEYADELIVEPGATARVTAFLQCKLVTATWDVVKTEIEDEYEIQLLLDYETQVPAPIVKVTMPESMPTLNEGESYAFNIHVENTGVIAAEKVTITMPDIPDHVFTLSDNDFRLAAKSAVDISAVYRRKRYAPVIADDQDPDNPDDSDNPDDPDNPENSDNPEEPDDPENPDNPEKPDDPENPDNPAEPDEPENPENPDDPGNPDNSGNSGKTPSDNYDDGTPEGPADECWAWVQVGTEYICGIEHPVYEYRLLLNHGYCDARDAVLRAMGDAWNYIDGLGGGGSEPGRNPGGDGSVSTNAFHDVPGTTIRRTDCDPCLDALRAAMDHALETGSWTLYKTIRDYLYSQIPFSSCVDLLVNTTMTVIPPVNDWVGEVTDSPGLHAALGDHFQSYAERRTAIHGVISATFDFVGCGADVLAAVATAASDGALALPSWATAQGVRNFAHNVRVVTETTIEPLSDFWTDYQTVEDLIFDSILDSYGPDSELGQRIRIACMGGYNERLRTDLNDWVVADGWYVSSTGMVSKIGGGLWEGGFRFDQMLDVVTNGFRFVLESGDMTIDADEFVAKGRFDIPESDVRGWIAEWNDAVNRWMAGEYDETAPVDINSFMHYAVLNYGAQEYVRKRGYEDVVEMMDHAMTDMRELLDESSDSVCASISLKFSQTLALTREAFDGTLTMYNGHSSVPITALKLDISVLDAEGNERKDLFEVFANGVSGDMAGGEDVLEGGLSVRAGGTGSAMVRFIPERGAAPTEDTLYRFGGTVTYIDPFSGEQATVKLTPVSLTVSPSPYLHLDYFVQRDVYADDPFTPDVVEASMPAELAVLVRNNGGGEARNVRISSVQPETVRNEKGLLTAFRLSDYTDIRSALDGSAANLSISDVALGSIQAGNAKVAQWWLTSSIEGHFTGLTATVTPVNSWNTPDTSLVDPDVGTHKLVRSIVADGDALPDFLTSEEDDLYGRPDTIWTAAGEVIEVYAGTLAATARPEDSPHLVGAEMALAVALTPARSGWNYAEVEIPGLFRYTIAKIERADGSEVPLRNAWITDRTFRDGLTPLLVEKFHIVDEFTSNEAAAYTVTLAAKPTDGPEVVSFEGVSNGAVESAVRNSVTVVFSTAVDPASFTAADLSLLHQGAFVADLSALAIAPETGDETGTRFVVSGLAAVCPEPGRNELTVQCAGIANLSGTLGTAGRSVAWTYSAAEAPYIVGVDGVPRRAVQSLDTVTVVLSTAVDPASFTADALRLDGVAVGAGVSVRALDESGTRFEVSGLAAAQSEDGEHTLAIDPTALVSLDGEAGVAGGGDVVTWRRDTVAPRLLAVEREEGFAGTRFVVRFSEEVEENDVSIGRFALVREAARGGATRAAKAARSESSPRQSGDAIAIPATATLENLGGGRYALSGIDSALAADGAYTLTFTADGVADEAGNEAEGTASVAWTRDATPPAQVDGLRISPDLGASDSDGVTAQAAVTVLGTLPDDAATVEIAVRWAGGSEQVIVPAFAPESTTLAANVTLPGSGNMTLVVRCSDAAGNASETTLAIFLDGLALTASLSGAPGDADDVADTLTLAFSDAVVAGDVTLAQFALARDGAALSLAGATLSSGSAEGPSATFTLSGLDALCAEDGAYRLVFNGAGVRKASSGRAMDTANATVVASWTRYAPDIEPPTVVSVRIDGADRASTFFDSVSSVEVAFSEPVNVPDLVSGGWIGQAVKLLRLGSNAEPEATVLALPEEVSWNGETATLRWTLPDDIVGLGDWRLALDAGFISDTAGNALAADGADESFNGLIRFAADAAVAVRVASYAMPSFGDFDGDGDLDLLVGEKSADGLGRVQLYRNAGLSVSGTPAFISAGTLSAGGGEIALAAQGCQGASAALLPRSTSSSSVSDLIVGDAFGNVWLYRADSADPEGDGSTGEVPPPDGDSGGQTSATPSWGEGQLLFSGDAEEFGSARAVVAACDLTGNGRAMLVIGGMDGKLRRAVGRLRNAGLAGGANPHLAWLVDDNGEQLAVAAGRSAPATFDLNGDGLPDFVSGDTTGAVWAFLGNGSYSWCTEPICLLGAGSYPDRSRVAIADFIGGAPLLAVGRSDGSVRLHAGAAASSPSFAFTVTRTPPSLSKALDAPGLDWTTGGDAEWTGFWSDASVKGGNAACSGEGLGEGESSWLETSFSGGGLLSFSWRLNGEAPLSGALTLSIDGASAPLASASALSEWMAASQGVTDGTHTVRWTWTQGASSGETAWLDAVSWTLAPWAGASSQSVIDALAEFREELVGDGVIGSTASEAEFNAAALSDADGDGFSTWDEFIAGTDSEDFESVFTASIEIVDGQPVVTWTPDLHEKRSYRVLGRKSLGGDEEWEDVTDLEGHGAAEGYRFFKAEVNMPK